VISKGPIENCWPSRSHPAALIAEEMGEKNDAASRIRSRLLADEHGHGIIDGSNESVVIEVGMGHYDCHQRWVLIREAGNVGQRDVVVPASRERPADIEHDPGPACLNLDAVAADLVGASVNPYSHLVALRPGGTAVNPRYSSPVTDFGPVRGSGAT
jgi:hypothetical protein